MEEIKINSKEYWETRFKTNDWEKNKGIEQTRFFYDILINLLPQWIISDINLHNFTTVDFGCAEGDGVPMLSTRLGVKVMGIDFSVSAVEKARIKYSNYHFEVGDINNYNKKIDVSILSNILEHFVNPHEILKKVTKFTNKYIVLMLPFEEENLMDEHHYCFRYNNIPIAVNNFNLVYFEEFDCLKVPSTHFFGKQILCIYTSQERVLNNISIEQSNGLLKLLNQKCEEYKTLYEKWEFAKDNNEALQGIINNSNANYNEMFISKQKVEKHLYEINDKYHRLITENEKQSTLFKELQVANNNLNSSYIELVTRFNNLNDAYGIAVNEKTSLINSRTWKVALLQKKIARKFGLIKVAKGLYAIHRYGIKECYRKYKNKKNINQTVIIDSIENRTNDNDNDEVINVINFRKNCYQKLLLEPYNEITKEIKEKAFNRNYRGVVVYPHAVKWEPLQRPQHLIREFAKDGYLTFFCEDDNFENNCIEVYENVFVIKGEGNLLPLLQDKHVLVLITYCLQTVFADFLPHKTIWFDILDRLDFFSLNNLTAKIIYTNLIEKADLITYSANNLKEYVNSRTDALLIQNAVNLEDFNISNKESVYIEEMECIKKSNKPIIGYYGAIEEWFDYKAIVYLADHVDCEIVIIGHVGIDKELLKRNNIHLLGRKDYILLPEYAYYFNIAIIPFIVNNLTNSVSPVKFFEYAAMNLPTISSKIYEMTQYESKNVLIYTTHADLVSKVKFLLKNTNYHTNELSEIASENTWENRFKKITNQLFKSPKNLAILSNINNDGIIAVETVTFFKYDGTNYYSGGAERYLLDLNEICKELNIKYRVFQYGEYDWVRFYNNVEVIGIGAIDNDVNVYNNLLINEIHNIFQKYVANQSVLNIYSPFYILAKKDSNKSIGISHGISWDSEYNHFTNGNDLWSVNSTIINSANFFDYLVSVDTNTANWFQTIDYDIGSKIKYIPNYVNVNEFSPRKDYEELRNKLIITYPRRLYGARGLYIALNVIDEILIKYNNVEFHFVGKGFEQDTKHVEEKIKKWGQRVKWYSKPPHLMHEVYKESDICLIPTLYSEGTSLSCLEALASGNAVIATRIGGLTDLIISGYNGILIEPNSESLKNAIIELIENTEKMNQLKNKAIQTAKAFSKKIWKEKWKETISNIGDLKKSQPYSESKKCLIKLNRNIINDDIMNIAKELLSDNYYVFIAIKKNQNRYQSFGRIQFIDINEDIYFKPDLLIDDSNGTLESYKHK